MSTSVNSHIETVEPLGHRTVYIPRKSWDQYFMDIAVTVASRSTCLRRQVGAIAVKDKRILATGYNGPPSGAEHCTTCIRDEMGYASGDGVASSRAVHAEINLIAQCAKFGIAIDGCTVYCTTQPCSECMKALIQVGMKRLVIKDRYEGKLTEAMTIIASKLGIEIVFL